MVASNFGLEIPALRGPSSGINFECPISDIWSSLIKAPTSSFEKQSFGGGGTGGIDPSSFYSDDESV